MPNGQNKQSVAFTDVGVSTTDLKASRKPMAKAATATGEAATRAERIGKNLRMNRKALGLSQEELARMAGISHGLLSELEAGIAPNLEAMPDVSGALDRAWFAKMRELLDLKERAVA